MAERLPTFFLSKTLSLHKQLVDLFHGRDGIYTEDCWQADTLTIGEMLPKAARAYALRDILRACLGQRWTAQTAERMAWRIAGNLAAFKAGDAVPCFRVTDPSPWLPFLVLRVWPRPKGMEEVRCVGMAWHAAGQALDFVWPRAFFSVLARHVGFTARNRKRPMHDLQEIVGLVFYAKVVANSFGDGLTTQGVKCPQSFLKYNRAIIDMRRRIVPCPRAYRHACAKCAVGQDQCPASTHRLSYVRGRCVHCRREGVPMDPEHGGGICLDCFFTQRTHSAALRTT